MPKIHSTATVDPAACLADDVEVGPYCIVESDVRIGAGTALRSHAVVRRYTTMGCNNVVDAFVVLGGEPQDYDFDRSSVTHLRIGDDNIFREGVTISRATGDGNETIIGSRGYWMTGAHAGHNAKIDDDVVLVNNAALGGYAELGRRAILSGDVMVHQFVWIGEGVMSQGKAGASAHVPPFCMIAGINRVVGLNSVGLRRMKDLSDEDRRQVREAFGVLYRSGLTPSQALAEMDGRADWAKAASTFRDFLRRVLSYEGPHKRPLCPYKPRSAGPSPV